MAWANRPYNLLKPSNLLGFLLGAVIFAGIALLYWERSGFLLLFFDVKPFGLEKSQGVVVGATFVAASGWIVTSLVTLRNSVKQHTINTLLQSRLSATYMENVKAVNASFSSKNGNLIPLTKAEVAAPPPSANLGALGYVLNYQEFVAVGIRNGDLDEAVMKSSLRGIVCSTYCVAKELIDARRAEVALPKKSRTYENLCWLHERWRDDSQLPPRMLRLPVLPEVELAVSPDTSLSVIDRLYVLVTGRAPSGRIPS